MPQQDQLHDVHLVGKRVEEGMYRVGVIQQCVAESEVIEDIESRRLSHTKMVYGGSNSSSVTKKKLLESSSEYE